MEAEIAYRIARGLNVRIGWLVAGESPVRLNKAGLDAFDLFDKMSDAQTQQWLAYGRRILRNAP